MTTESKKKPGTKCILILRVTPDTRTLRTGQDTSKRVLLDITRLDFFIDKRIQCLFQEFNKHVFWAWTYLCEWNNFEAQK